MGVVKNFDQVPDTIIGELVIRLASLHVVSDMYFFQSRNRSEIEVFEGNKCPASEHGRFSSQTMEEPSMMSSSVLDSDCVTRYPTDEKTFIRTTKTENSCKGNHKNRSTRREMDTII
jgi:hypothetical protein